MDFVKQTGKAEKLIFLSFSFSALVDATYNNRVQKMLWDNCVFYMSVQ